MVGQAERLGERPNVVVSEAKRLDLGQFRVLREGGQHLPQGIQRRVQIVHPVPLAVVGLQAAALLEPLDRLGRLGQAGGVSSPAGASLTVVPSQAEEGQARVLRRFCGHLGR